MSQFDFLPEVWHADGWPPMLVCGRRWMHTAPIHKAKIPTTFNSIEHAVVIQLGDNPKVCFGFHGGGEGSDEVWVRHSPETYGLHLRAAELALVEAWRCVDVKIDPFKFHGHVKLNPDRMRTYRGGTPMRNIGIWLAWGRWQRDKLTFDQRLAEITAWGFPITPKAFRRLLEDDGMSI